jgi:uncharacterized protein YdiU (UPF0061 family)
MRAASPALIARNHRVEEALAAAVDDERPGPVRAAAGPTTSRPRRMPGYAEPAPRDLTAGYRTFCGT